MPKIVCVLAVEKFGKIHQLRKLQEELFELGTAISHYIDEKAPVSKVATELADVEILLEQARVIFGEANVEMQKSLKLKRLERLLAMT